MTRHDKISDSAIQDHRNNFKWWKITGQNPAWYSLEICCSFVVFSKGRLNRVEIDNVLSKSGRSFMISARAGLSACILLKIRPWFGGFGQGRTKDTFCERHRGSAPKSCLFHIN